MSLFDEDEMDCECCGHVGLIFNGDFDVEYPVCGAEYSLIIDEAHHIKNPNTYAYQAEQMFYDNAESIVLLTATPIQLGDRDLYVLLNLIHSDLVFDYDSFKHMSEPNPFINEAAKPIRGNKENWKEEALYNLVKAGNTNWGTAMLIQPPVYRNAV